MNTERMSLYEAARRRDASNPDETTTHPNAHALGRVHGSLFVCEVVQP